jgi:carbon starvation protein
MNNSGKYLIWAVLSVGSICPGLYRPQPGEQINALWIVVASVCIYLIAYRFYGRYIAKNVLAVDATRMTPAVRHNDGLDYVPTDKKVLFGHHFAAIAGAGPLVGPVLAADGLSAGDDLDPRRRGAGGAVQDFMVLFVSTRRDGRSLGELVKEEMGATAGVIALVATFMIMVIIRGAGDDRGESADPQPVGDVYRRLYHSAGAVYGDLYSLSASGAHWRGR